MKLLFYILPQSKTENSIHFFFVCLLKTLNNITNDLQLQQLSSLKCSYNNTILKYKIQTKSAKVNPFK